MFYRLINTKTNQPMGLSYNSTTIEEVREDIVTFISLDEDIAGLTETELADKIAATPIRIEQSEVMFEPYQKSTIDSYFISAEHIVTEPIKKHSHLRVKHVSTYALIS